MHARQEWHRDPQLTMRMFIVMFLLGALYLAFIGALFYVGVNILFIVVIAGGSAFSGLRPVAKALGTSDCM